MSTKPSRTRKALLALVAGFALLAPLAVMSTAHAGDDDYYDDTAPGGGTGEFNHEGGGTLGPNLALVCDSDGTFWLTGKDRKIDNDSKIWFEGPDMRCRERTGPGWQGEMGVCTTGFQVFRFYGTLANPVKGWTTSMVNYDQWCDFNRNGEGKPRSLMLTDTSGWDSASTVTRNNYANKKKANGKNPELASKFVGTNHRGLIIDPRYGGRWEEPLTGVATSSRPFAGNNGCVAAQTANPIEADIQNTSALSPEARQELKQALVNLFNNVNKEVRKQYRGMPGGAAAALRMTQKRLGLLEASTYLNANGKTRYTIKFDDRACGSSMRYVASQDYSVAKKTNAGKRNFPITGVCYIPLNRATQIEKNAAGQKVFRYPSMLRWGGIRYSTAYEGKAYSADKPRGQRGAVADGVEKQVLKAWRKKMADWYRGQTKAGKYLSLFKNKRQVTPANPYNPDHFNDKNGKVRNAQGVVRSSKQNFARAKAVKALRDTSLCKFGPRMSYNTSETGGHQPPPPTVGMDIDVPEIQQAGGFSNIQQIPLSTSFETESDAVDLDSLTYDVRVTMPDGMKIDGTDAEVVSVDGSNATATNCTVAPGGQSCTFSVSVDDPASDVTLNIAYHRATPPGERVKVEVFNMEGSYSLEGASTTLNFSGSIGGIVVRDGDELSENFNNGDEIGGRVEDHVLPTVRLNGRDVTKHDVTSWELSVIGATATGR